MPDLDVWFPRKLAFLREPHRYKVLYGGRAGIKSWSIAQFLLHAGFKRPLRIPCARETMMSIKESVHQLLEDQITRLGLQAHYTVQKAEIIGRNGTSFTFHGLRDRSVHNIKSLEGADILWVEEAQNVSKHSWRTVIPTIRKPGSEIWISFNPELETDDTYKRFVVGGIGPSEAAGGPWAAKRVPFFSAALRQAEVGIACDWSGGHSRARKQYMTLSGLCRAGE